MLPSPVILEGERMTIRDATADDVGLIFATWMESARQLRNARLSIFDKFYPDVVRSLLETETAAVMTLEGKDAIHAWACGRAPNLLHFAYVPKNLRGHGLGRAVIDATLGGYPATVFVTATPLSNANHRRFVYNPFVMRTA